MSDQTPTYDTASSLLFAGGISWPGREELFQALSSGYPLRRFHAARDQRHHSSGGCGGNRPCALPRVGARIPQVRTRTILHARRRR